jgi:hypothetical protein
MLHTLWSDGTLLGETDFGLGSPQPGGRVGVFHPTPAGLAAIPVLANVVTTARATAAMLQREEITRERLGDAVGPAIYEALTNSPEGQRAAEARAAVEALHLELRDADGHVVRTGQITVFDIVEIVPPFAGLPAEGRLEVERMGFGRYLLCATDESPD